MRKHYTVAGHGFTVDAEEAVFTGMNQYTPFLDEENTDSLFTLYVQELVTPIIYNVKYKQEDEGQVMLSGETPDGKTVLEYQLRGKVAGWLVCSHDFTEGNVYYNKERQRLFVVNNALMMMYTFITSDKQTTLFHSSVVSYQGKAYMFLGKSGTGKSTHSQLWLKYIEGTELVNDDNPVVRIIDGEARVYGSPWSGKTPCYRNVDYPIGGIVKLKQAPFNEIRRMKAVEAYVALAMSISGMRWNTKMGDGLHHTENLLTATVPVWHLSCLPDQNAAELCQTTIAVKD
jgi:hypothetical protein